MSPKDEGYLIWLSEARTYRTYPARLEVLNKDTLTDEQRGTLNQIVETLRRRHETTAPKLDDLIDNVNLTL